MFILIPAFCSWYCKIKAAFILISFPVFVTTSKEKGLFSSKPASFKANICQALQAIDAPLHPPRPLGAAEIVSGALEAADTACLEALDLFCAFLGTAAGNLALTLGARGGVYIGGGIVPRLGEAFAQSPFRQRFEDKGRFASYLAQTPVYVIHAAQSPALLGAARALDRAAPSANGAPA